MSSSLNKEVRQLEKARVVLPLNEMVHIVPQHSVDSYLDEDYSFTFVAYYDSMECLSCRMSQIGKWNSVIQKANRNSKVRFYFIIAPSLDQFTRTMETYANSEFLHDIYLDKNHAFERDNPFLKKTYFHFFLMNSQNRILYLGNPTNSEESESKLLSVLHKTLSK